MENINVTPDCKLIKVLADQAQGICTDGIAMNEANEIIQTLAQDMSPQNRHQIAQTMAYTLTDMSRKELNSLDSIADHIHINYGDKAAFKIKNEKGIKAVFQARGATTPRSYVSEKEVLVETEEVSARPAINIMDLRTGRVNMADLIREANYQMYLLKLGRIESVLQAAMANYSSPFYATGTGIVQSSLNAQINYFRRLGQVSLLGDIAAVSQLSDLTGMAMNSTTIQRSDDMLNEFNSNGFIGRYIGCPVVALDNAYADDSTNTILADNWIYLVPGGLTADTKNLKIVDEGDVYAFEAQDINDLVYEVRLDQRFGAAFVSGKNPTIGAYCIN